jgi:hypothetical protein
MKERTNVDGFWQRLVGAGEEKLGQFADEILSSQHVTEALASALRRAAQTKGTVDRNLQLVLSALNLPTKNDYNRLVTKIEALQGSLVNLNIKLDRMMAAQSQPPKRPPAKRAARGGTGQPGGGRS